MNKSVLKSLFYLYNFGPIILNKDMKNHVVNYFTFGGLSARLKTA
ncbi:hypothetical protein CIT292_07436 [Citrobacter youngae ATCC 29220]|uniref:Uncharacterized protein n=1 Tax=Citrobacter youngae ATCC 29220 TaxID=500640 RepID=D4BAE2_9ENTR|nr:hypothetical protein CIT292_07436 [Citrobacter youngae ATCC 29220]